MKEARPKMLAESQPAELIKPNSKLGYGDYLRFRDLVLERSGLHFPEKKWADLEAGLLKALATSPLTQKGHYNLDEYYYLLCDRNDPTGRTEMDHLIKVLTIGETYFFRDQGQFNALANQVLPALIARKRAAAAGMGIPPQLRIWSAGCATGEEPYSLAILLKELLPDLDDWRIFILATDINLDALARAREGLYSDWSFREVRAKALQPHYFTLERSLNRYCLRQDVRQMVTFAALNLIEDDYPAVANNTTSIDLILCRNVTIYFTQEITQRVINRFYEALTEGGWLVVGHSEPSLLIYRAFQAHTFPDTLLYQKTDRPSSWPTYGEGLAAVLAANKDSAASPPPALTPHQTSAGQSFNPPTAPTQKEGLSAIPTPNGAAGVKPNRLAAPPIVTDLYELAQVSLQKGQVEAAIATLQQALQADRNFAPALSLLGLANANLGRWEEARQWCQSALKLNSLLTEAYYVLSLVDQHEGNLEAAIAQLKKAIYIDRQAPLYHFNLGLLYRQQGETRLAQRAYHNVVRILAQWPANTVIPDSGGATAKHLLGIARRFLERKD